MSAVLAPWRKLLAVHDPAKVLLDLAVALGLGGTAWPTSRWSAAQSWELLAQTQRLLNQR
jgi:hypothetical protein